MILSSLFWTGFFAGVGCFAIFGLVGVCALIWWIIRHEPEPGDDKFKP
jgi:hypothetical protein